MLTLRTPEFIQFHLEGDMGADIGGQGAGDPEGDFNLDVGDTDLTESSEEETPVFYEYDFGPNDYGEERKGSLKSKEELDEHFRERYMLHSGFTRKTQEAAETEKKRKAEYEKYESEQKSFFDAKNRWNEQDAKLKSLPAEQFNEFFNLVKGHLSVDPALKEIQDRLAADDKEKETRAQAEEQEKAQQQTARMIESTTTQLQKIHPNFDSKAVMAQIAKIRSGTPEMQMYSLMEAIHKGSTAAPNPPTPRKNPLGGGSGNPPPAEESHGKETISQIAARLKGNLS